MRPESNEDNSQPLTRLKSLFLKHVDPQALCLGTGAATLGRLAFYPVEATSFSLQIGAAKTVEEAIKLNFNRSDIKASFKGGTSLVKSAVLASGAYYGLGFAVMNRHKNEPILVQSSWGLVTVLPEQISVIEATKTVRSRNNLSSSNISRMGWARINTGFFLRHLYGNPATFAAVKTMEKLLQEIVPENYHPASSFAAGAAGPWLIHRAGYAFLVATSVQLMVSPEQSFKEAWKKAAKENYIKAGDIRAAGRMGTSAIAFCVWKIYEVYFSKDRPKPSKPTVGNANFFSNSDAEKAAVSDSGENHTHSARKT